MNVTKKSIVSVVVLSYNAESTIIDTLNSILEQSYSPANIELIISDDCSQDSTVHMIEKWLCGNRNYFYHCVIFYNKTNIGICGNINQAWSEVTSNWVKAIAADDLLSFDCIDIFSKYSAMVSDNVACIFSNVKKFQGDVFYKSMEKRWLNNMFNLDSRSLYKRLLLNNFLDAPGSFIRHSALVNIGFADIDNFILEDYPLWLNFLSKGFQFEHIDSELVFYRVGNGISTDNSKLINELVFVELMNTLDKSSRANFNKFDFLYWAIRYDVFLMKVRIFLSLKIFCNKKNLLSIIVTIPFRVLPIRTLIYKVLKIFPRLK
jgi:glycosyltransferase involved in cell wall biosynthesis